MWFILNCMTLVKSTIALPSGSSTQRPTEANNILVFRHIQSISIGFSRSAPGAGPRNRGWGTGSGTLCNSPKQLQNNFWSYFYNCQKLFYFNNNK